MKRIVKFRGKEIESDEWVYGSLTTYPNGRCEIVVFDNGEILEYEVDADSVGQFTSVHDKNGKEIYEGDVVEFVDFTYIPFDGIIRVGNVVYSRGAFEIRTKNGKMTHLLWGAFDDCWNTLEVIDNIHDTPQLLNDGRD